MHTPICPQPRVDAFCSYSSSLLFYRTFAVDNCTSRLWNGLHACRESPLGIHENSSRGIHTLLFHQNRQLFQPQQCEPLYRSLHDEFYFPILILSWQPLKCFSRLFVSQHVPTPRNESYVPHHVLRHVTGTRYSYSFKVWVQGITSLITLILNK